MKLTITIDGDSRSVILPSLSITKEINGRLPQCSFNMNIEGPTPSVAPGNESEVIVSNTDTSEKIFRGYVTSIIIGWDTSSVKTQIWQVSCIGLEYLLENNTINRTWTGMTDRQILQDAFTSVLSEITTDSSTVSELSVALDFQAKDLTLVQLVQQLASLSGADWRVTEDKALSYYASGSIVAPFGFSDSPNV